MPDYLQHGRRHGPGGTDPIPGFGAGVTNDWVSATAALGTVASGTPTNASFTTGTITYQTDDGSVFGYGTGSVDTINMLQVGTYLIRAIATYPSGHAGTVKVGAVIAGDVTTLDYNAVLAGTTGVDSSGGQAIWEQLCVVNDLTVAAGAYITFTQTTGTSLVGCTATLQILRFT